MLWLFKNRKYNVRLGLIRTLTLFNKQNNSDFLNKPRVEKKLVSGDRSQNDRLNFPKSNAFSDTLAKHVMKFSFFCYSSWQEQNHCTSWWVWQTALPIFLSVEVHTWLGCETQCRNFICSRDENEQVFIAQIRRFVCQVIQNSNTNINKV